MFFLSLMSLYSFFRKKILSLLMIELCFLSVIFLFFFFSYSSLFFSSFFSMMVFLGFMVMDSVLGLCCLVVSTRSSSSFSNFYFSS